MMSTQWARLAVDGIVIFHALFVLFVLFGGLLMLKWRGVVWLHIPALCWGILVEFSGWLCPLTPLENHLREKAGLGMYHGDFVMHYIMPVLYPMGLTRNMQIIFGLVVILLNLGIYAFVIRRYLLQRRRVD